jgi:hypothetical protein
VKVEGEEEPSAAEYGGQVPGEKEPDDTNDFIGLLAYMAKKAKEGGTVDQLIVILEGMGEEKATILAIKASPVQEPPLLRGQPRYAAAHMPKGCPRKRPLSSTWRPHAHRPSRTIVPWEQWPEPAPTSPPPPVPPHNILFM